MLILKDIRKNINFFKSKIKSRYVNNSDSLLDALLKDDESLRKQLEIQQELQNKRNLISKALGSHKDKNSIDFKGLSSDVSEVKNQINEIESSISDLRDKIDKTLYSLPNIPLNDVPEAEDEKGNVEIKKVGQIREFDFEPLGS